MSTFIHHPNCYLQEPAQGHYETGNSSGSCNTGEAHEDGSLCETFMGWPKAGALAPVAQEATSAPFLPPSVPVAPTQAGPTTWPPAIAPGPAYDQPTSAAAWKANAGKRDLLLPSGHVCRVKKRGGMDMFLRNGMVPNGLMPIIQAHMNDGREVDMAKMAKDVTEDPTKLSAMLEMADNILLATVADPVIFPTPRFSETDAERGALPMGMSVGDIVPESMRNPEFLYVDEVDMDDKMFIFQWATGGTSDVERFRSEQAAAMENIPTVEGVGAAPVANAPD